MYMPVTETDYIIATDYEFSIAWLGYSSFFLIEVYAMSLA